MCGGHEARALLMKSFERTHESPYIRAHCPVNVI